MPLLGLSVVVPGKRLKRLLHTGGRIRGAMCALHLSMG